MPWLLALPLLLLTAWPAWASDAPSRTSSEPPRVTTENAEYCEMLAERLAASPQPVADRPRDLGEEGQRLCANGHVRAGIAKLRRALRASRAEARGG